jgi:hypothetical protein
MKRIFLLLALWCSAAFSTQQVIPVTYQLFGPAHAADGVTSIHGAIWKAPGSCFTCNTQWFPFEHNVPAPRSVRFLICWIPRNTNTIVRVINFDNGPTNIVEMGRMNSNGSMTPSCQAMDLTSQFLQLKLNQVGKHIGFQIVDDGVNQWTLYEAQLEVTYEVGQ